MTIPNDPDGNSELVEAMLREEILWGNAPMSEMKFDLLLEGVLDRPTRMMTDGELLDRISIAQAAFDRLLLEIERRDLLPCSGDRHAIPFNVPPSRRVTTILTRHANSPLGDR